MSHDPPRGLSLHNKILLALVLGIVAGVAVNLGTREPALRPRSLLLLAVQPGAGLPGAVPWAAFAPAEPSWIDLLIRWVMRPIGEVFLRLLFLTVVPLVFASLALGVAQLGRRGNLGRIGLRTFAYFIVTMTMAVIIGLVLVNTVKPGVGLPPETSQRLLQEYGQEASKRTGQPSGFGIETFVNIVPRNPLAAMVQMDMLAVIFFALLIGLGLTCISEQRARLLIDCLEGVNDLMVTIIGWAMRLAPYGVFALIFSVTARFGFDLLLPLGWYVVVVLVGLAIQMFGVLSILLATLSRLNPLVFFRKVRNVMITAFSTSSSNATLPTSIKTAEEELGIPAPIAGFVLPLGATMNMNGTALFEGVTVVFLAQVFGVPLTLGDQLVVIVLAVLTAIGAAGVPGGSLPLLVMVLATVGVPEMGIALILGVDRLLDMCRTTLNVIGDLAAATYVAHAESRTFTPVEIARDAPGAAVP
jgi:DAACS family dicarboxylate/amino acid:cation (Na+ or H+) symporter